MYPASSPTLMFFLLGASFLTGCVTLFAPCIWPLLPIILSASSGSGRRRPLGIVLGIATSFSILTLTLASLIRVFPLDPDSLRFLAFGVILFFGCVLLIPAFGRWLEGRVSRLSGFVGRFLHPSGSGFAAGFLVGGALGIVWSPCAGPILATVATLAATASVNVTTVLITLAFAAGVSVPLFFFSVVSQNLLTRTRWLSPYTGRIQQAFGVLMIVAALAIFTGYDKVLQTKLLDTFPRYGAWLTLFEGNSKVESELRKLESQEKSINPSSEKQQPTRTSASLPVLGNAPEFAGIDTWLNTENGKALSLAELRGRVVLVDFWTYSCINCIRTLPYVTTWYERYRDQGFVVVGVHTPEFAFEQKTANVEQALRDYNITYPVAQDNAYMTWRAYQNRYWPAHYLIDAEGRIREKHFGEGEYTETEAAIRSLLMEAGEAPAALAPVPEKEAGSLWSMTPELYLGSDRSEALAESQLLRDGVAAFSLPEKLPLHHYGLGGVWRTEGERVSAEQGSVLQLHFRARKVFLVLAPPASGSADVRVWLDGAPIAENSAGADVRSSALSVTKEELYRVVELPAEAETEHMLQLTFETPGTSAYAFTFGG